MASKTPFNIVIVGQSGRLAREAILFCASLRKNDPNFSGRLFVAEPLPGKHWGNEDPRIPQSNQRKLIEANGAEIVQFESRHFGAKYPYGNKIEALAAIPDEPFVFFDTDTLITGPISDIPFDFARPSASMRREGTWPRVFTYGYTRYDIWKSLYDRMGLDIAPTIDPEQPDGHWEQFMYFNAGWFFYESPKLFRQRMLDYMLTIRNDAPDELFIQQQDPWLDQIALPLAIHSLGGGRPGEELDPLDGTASCHYRTFPLLYARENDEVVELLEEICARPDYEKVLKHYAPIKRMVYEGQGREARKLFDQEHPLSHEGMIRKRLKNHGFWIAK